MAKDASSRFSELLLAPKTKLAHKGFLLFAYAVGILAFCNELAVVGV